MRIRKMESRDNQPMKRILQESLRDAQLDKPGTAYFDPQLDELASYYEKLAHGAYWVAVNEQDEVVGGVGIGPLDWEAGICELQKLYIDKSARGHGLSKQLMKQAMDYALQDGYERIYIVTDSRLPVANQLYQKYRFERLQAPLPQDPHPGCDTWYIRDIRLADAG